jgi:hypothetical protein
LWRVESPTLTVAREPPPVRIAGDRDYSALAPGTKYVGPDGQTYIKPWQVTREDPEGSYEAVPEGAGSSTPRATSAPSRWA